MNRQVKSTDDLYIYEKMLIFTDKEYKLATMI